jgi:hypothetical protein
MFTGKRTGLTFRSDALTTLSVVLVQTLVTFLRVFFYLFINQSCLYT